MAVRIGDVYALLIEYYYSLQTQPAIAKAFELLKRMRANNIVILPYVDSAMVRHIYDVMGMSLDESGGTMDAEEAVEEVANETPAP